MLDGQQSRATRAQRHHLLGDPSRLAIVEALEEGPRQIPELSRLIGIHRTTVQGHLDKLMAAGLVNEEPGVPGQRGRPSKRYRLRVPLLGGEPAMRMFVQSLVALLHRAYGEDAISVSEEAGRSQGRALARTLGHPPGDQKTAVVTDILEHLGFAPRAAAAPHDAAPKIDPEESPFWADRDGAIAGAFHEGLVHGMAEVASHSPDADDVAQTAASGADNRQVDIQPVGLQHRPTTNGVGRRRAAQRRTTEVGRLQTEGAGAQRGA